jgi:hypothetical protein
MRGPIIVALAIGAASVAPACRRDVAPVKAAEPQILWRPVGSWSGHGNSQTESFHGETGALRVRWDARPEPANGKAGAFRLTAHSAISGRILEQVVDREGPGSGVGYVNTEPHTFYISVEATGLSWTFSVDEGIPGQVVGDAGR